MVALAQYIPSDPEEKESVLAVLREHPEVQDFIVRASEKAEELFPEFSIAIDTVRYDEWDPPATMTIFVTQPLAEFESAYDAYIRWLVNDRAYRPDLLHVMPVWRGPLETHT